MAEQFIPAGRTSSVEKRGVEYQLQTEYARHPRCRVTTTIFSQGRVLHKIERSIESEVNSLERMHEVEDIITAQHLEVSKIVAEKGLSGHAEKTLKRSEEKIRSSKIQQLEEVERVYLVTPEGKLIGDRETTRKFRKMFRHVLKGLPQILKVFAALPGADHQREEGIYEVEAGRILLASTGAEFYLILLKPKTDYLIIALKIKAILAG